MRRLVTLGLLLALTACTGTFEIRPAVLLVVSLNDGAPELGLITDNFGTGTSTAPRELTFLSTSRRSLPAPAMALDVVDRSGQRPTLVVLSRKASAPFSGYLRAFSLTGVDPLDPAAFAEDASFARDLSQLLRDQDELADDEDYCLVDIQISGDGRYLALLEDRSACLAGDDTVAVYLIDLSDDSLVAAVDTRPVVAAGVYLDQQQDYVYYLVEGVGNATLERLAVASGDREVVADLEGFDQVDVAAVGPPIGSPADDSLLLALSDDAFQAIDAVADPAEPAAPVATTANAAALIDDPFATNERIVILGTSSFTVHRNVDDADGRSATIVAASATFQPEELFVYLAGEGRITIFDVLIDDGTGTPRLSPFLVPELIDPGPMNWLRSELASP